MKIATTRFGEIEIDENLVFDFVDPILGYEQYAKYALVDYMPDSPFKWLQSVENPDIAFPVTFPAYFGLDYQFVIPEQEAKKLGLTSADELLSVNIACIPQGRPQDATINLLGPIIINAVNKKAMQLVLVNTNHSIKQRLFPGNPEKVEETKPEGEKVEI